MIDRRSCRGDQPIARLARALSATRLVSRLCDVDRIAKIFAYDKLDGLKQFPHSCPMAGSEIQSLARAVIQEVLDGAGMRIGKIENMDEVAHAGSITRVIVRVQNLKIWPTAQSGLDCDGYSHVFPANAIH
jgi:hypothetical protein